MPLMLKQLKLGGCSGFWDSLQYRLEGCLMPSGKLYFRGCWL